MEECMDLRVFLIVAGVLAAVAMIWSDWDKRRYRKWGRKDE